MGGPNTKPSESIAGKQTGLGDTMTGVMEGFLPLGKEDTAAGKGIMQQGIDLLQPAIKHYTDLASGDRGAMTAAAAPALSEISKQYQLAGERSFDQARGVGQEFTQSQLGMAKAGQVAGAMSEAYTSSFDKLTGLGTTVSGLGNQYANLGLQETGAGLSAGQLAEQDFAGAAQTQQSMMQAQAAKKQATMGFLGNIVGAAGSMATGGLSGGLSGLLGGGSKTGGSTINSAGIAFPSQNRYDYSQ
jgi:hypothetical protein